MTVKVWQAKRAVAAHSERVGHKPSSWGTCDDRDIDFPKLPKPRNGRETDPAEGAATGLEPVGNAVGAGIVHGIEAAARRRAETKPPG